MLACSLWVSQRVSVVSLAAGAGVYRMLQEEAEEQGKAHIVLFQPQSRAMAFQHGGICG
jgi:hypothetical protein